MASVLFRTLIVYTLLSFTLRVMGKRQIGELQLSELVSTFILSEIVATPIVNTDLPLLYAIISVCLIISLEIILTYAKNKSSILKKLLDSKPNVIIEKGELKQDELRTLRISVEELLSELRLQGVSDIGDVRYAIVEPNGKLSLILKGGCEQATVGQLGLEPDSRGLSYSIIVDGEINKKNLARSGHDEGWLCGILKKKKLSPKDIFLFSVNDAEEITVIKKSKDKK